MCKILIEVSGGSIQKITTDRNMKIILLDRDNNFKEDNIGLIGEYSPDVILPIGEKFSKEFGKSEDEQDKIVYETLKSMDI